MYPPFRTVPPHQAIGEPVPAWKYFPPAKVVGDVFGPTFRPKKGTGMTKPPFREAISIALTKQVTRRATPNRLLFRGGVLNRTYGTHKNLYISLFILPLFGPLYYGPTQ